MAYAILCLHGFLMSIDELWFHRKRGLGNWERVGHPIDALFFALPVGYLLVFSFDPSPLVFLSLSVVSCLVITKDEWVHRLECGTGERVLHAILFMLHPVLLYLFWENRTDSIFLAVAFSAIVAVLMGQAFYWNFLTKTHEQKG